MTKTLRSASIGAFVLLAFTPALRAQTTETMAGTASATAKDGKTVSIPVSVVINHAATNDERDALVRAVKTGGSEAARTLLSTRDAVGMLQLGGRSTPVKYVYVRSTGSGRLITVITSEQIPTPAPRGPQSRPPSIGLLLIELPDSAPGHGELMMAAKVRVDEQGAIVTDTYDPADVMMLSNISRK
jgi:hypothetical protein